MDEEVGSDWTPWTIARATLAWSVLLAGAGISIWGVVIGVMEWLS